MAVPVNSSEHHVEDILVILLALGDGGDGVGFVETLKSNPGPRLHVNGHGQGSRTTLSADNEARKVSVPWRTS